MNKQIFTGLIIAWTLMSLATRGHAQSCTFTSQGNDITPDGVCAPVVADWEIIYRGVQDSGTGDVSIYIDWDDGTVETIPALEIDPGNWQVIAPHTYPKGGDQCNYEAQVMLMVNGDMCYSSIQTQTVTVWDTDDSNGGIISISPDVYPICVGSDGTVQFTDASLWNCTPPYEEDRPNNLNRWTQWIYGTGGTTITDAEAEGITYSWPHAGPIDYYNPPALGPAQPPSLSETIYIPPGHNVGDYFEITIRNWNTCNPYNEDLSTLPGDLINGDNPPVETTAIALIVAMPDGTVDAAGPFCETDAPVTLNAATDGGTWSGPGVDPTSGLFTPLDAGPGNHTIYYDITDANGCSASGSTNIEVKESPVVTISPGTAIYLCPGMDLQLTADITNGTAPYTIQWTGDTGPLSATNVASPQFNTSTTGTYNLILEVTDDAGCINYSDITIEIEDITVIIDPTPIEACAGIITEINPTVSGGTTNFISHSWTGPDTDKLSETDVSNPDFLSAETGTFTYTYTVVDDKGCSNSGDIEIAVKEQPIANPGNDDSTCNTEYQLNGNDDGKSDGEWQFYSGPGNISFDDPTRPDATAQTDIYGTYELMWSLYNDGCTDSGIVQITFAESPSPLAGADIKVCGLSDTLEAIPDIAHGQWSVTSGPGNISFTDSTNPLTEVTVDAPGTYSFDWIEVSPEGCIGKATQIIEFMPQAVAEVNSFNSTGCSPHEISFTNSSVNTDSYQWGFGDGSSSSNENPTHVFQITGSIPETFKVTMQAENSYNCNDKISFDVIVNPSPTARFEAADMEGCSPLIVGFNNTSSGADSYLWDFGDNTPAVTDRHPEHTFVNSEDYVQSYLVNLVAENSYGCTDHHSGYVSAYPVRTINLNASPQEGCSPLSVLLTTEPGAKEYSWNYGDGNTEQGTYTTSHIFENNTSEDLTFQIDVTGTSTFGCSEQASTTVLVHPSPKASFDATPHEQQMPERTVTVTNQTPGQWNYMWDFGDGTTADEENPSPYQYTESGNYEIFLRAYSDYCETQVSTMIKISPMVPAIDYGDDQSGCPPLTVSFFNNTLDATSYLWEFGDGRLSQDPEPTHTFRIPGTYNVKLTAYGPGGTVTSDDVTIEVFENPTPIFEAVPKVVYIPNEGVNFINKSENADNYLWLFGDGETSAEFSPTHVYSSTGFYNVTLSVENDRGCTNEITIPNAVKAEQGGEIELPNAFTPNKNGPSNGQYNYGDRSNHVFYPFVQKGIVEYQLQIYSRWGELMFESNDINQGWDGYFRGNLSPQGVYIWRITATYSNGKRIEKTGDVTLLR